MYVNVYVYVHVQCMCLSMYDYACLYVCMCVRPHVGTCTLLYTCYHFIFIYFISFHFVSFHFISFIHSRQSAYIIRYIYKYIYIIIPADQKPRSQKARFQKKIFSLQRNAQFDRQNLAKFGRANLAKFAFRAGFWQKCARPFFILCQTRRFSVEIVFCWRRLCPLTYRHCQHLTYKRRSLLFELNELGTPPQFLPHPTPPHHISSVSTCDVVKDPRDLSSVAVDHVRSTRCVNIPHAPHPTPSAA